MWKRMMGLLAMIAPLMIGCANTATPQKATPPPVQEQPLQEKQVQVQQNIAQPKATITTQMTTQPSPQVILNAPILSQKPELKNGCEVTSLAMLLQYAGVRVGKMELSAKVPKDTDPLRLSGVGDDVTHWGNPHHGFVGDITGEKRGYAVYHKPMEQLMKQYLPGRADNLTGGSFADLQQKIRSGKPVVVWTTVHYSSPRRWDTWSHKGEQIRATREEHAVLLVGFDPNSVYVNDPLTGRKAQPVDKRSFLDSWDALGRQALSYR